MRAADDVRRIVRELAAQPLEQIRSFHPVGEPGRVVAARDQGGAAGASVSQQHGAPEAGQIDSRGQAGGPRPDDDAIVCLRHG